MSEAIDATLRHAVESGQVPGVVAMATNGQDTLYEGAFGLRRLGDKAAMTLDSVFWIASMTKAITSVACMQLVEQGRVGLHTPLGALMPKLSDPQVIDGFGADGQPHLRPAKRQVTLHDLLTHTAGYAYEMWNAEIGRYFQATGRPRMNTGLIAAIEQPLVFDPGARWEYSIAIDWAGQVIEAVTGQTLGAYFAEHIFAPLGMGDTQFGAPVTDRLAAMHTRDADGSLRPGTSGRLARPELESGGGGLYSTAPDYLRFLAALLSGGWKIAAARNGGADGPEPDRRARCHPARDLSAGLVEPGRIISWHDEEMGLRLPDQHGAGPCRPQPRQPNLGWTAQLLLLARPGPARRGPGYDAIPTLRRFRRTGRARPVRGRDIRRITRSHLIVLGRTNPLV